VPNRFLVASDSVCPCGAVRSAHLPVKEKAASSNLVRGARHRPGEVAQLAEHATENRGVGSSILPLATVLTCAYAFEAERAPTVNRIVTAAAPHSLIASQP
jgi:hypothetical protein